MAINKKLIHFKKYSDFNSKKLSANEANTQYTVGIGGAISSGSPDVLYQSVCWIKDVQKMWTHGTIYDCSEGGATITETDIVNMGFTKNQGTITEVKINGVSKGTSGVIDLGNVPTKEEFIDHTEMLITLDEDVAALYDDKQDAITDLQTIREGAAKGATSVQPSDIEDIAYKDSGYVIANGILDENDKYWHMPDSSLNDKEYTLASKSDIPSAVTESTISDWGFTKNAGTYSKPSGGIPSGDLAEDVRSALRSAEAYRGTITNITINGSTKSPTNGIVDLGSVGTYSKPSTGIPKSDLANDVQTMLNSAVTRDAWGDLDVIQMQAIGGSLNSTIYALPDEANGNEDDILLSRDTVKTINGQSIFGSGNIVISGGGSSSGGNGAYPEVDGSIYTSPAFINYYDVDELMPNTFYVFPECDGLIISAFGEEISGIANEYLFQFTSGSESTTLMLPDDIKWANDAPPTIEPNMIYQVSILKGLASVMSWDNSNLIAFSVLWSISGTLNFECEKGMTWEAFVASSYNTDSALRIYNGNIWYGSYMIQDITPTTIIENGKVYTSIYDD